MRGSRLLIGTGLVVLLGLALALVVSLGVACAKVSLAREDSSLVLVGLRIGANGISFAWRREDGVGVGKEELSESQEAKRILSYFYSALTIPTENWWADLYLFNPETKLLGDGLEYTELGHVMLDSDLRMKLLVNRLMSPDSPTGEGLWDRLARLGVDGFSPRFWMVPGAMEVYATEDELYIKEAGIDVEVSIEDADIPEDLKEEIKSILKETVIPEIERAINYSQEFAPLRKAYYAMLLAGWAKEALKERYKQSRLASLVDSYTLPDVGAVKVNRVGFLGAFASDYLLNRMDDGLMSVEGGGEVFTNLPNKVGEELQPMSGSLEDSTASDAGAVLESDVPPVKKDDEVATDGGYKNRAGELGLDPKLVHIYGDVMFKGISAQDAIGKNVLIVNLTHKPLEISKEFVNEFVEKYSKDNPFYSNISNAVIIRDSKGIFTFSLVGKLKDRATAVARLDTVGKIMSYRLKEIKGLVFSERPGEELPEEEKEILRRIVPQVHFLRQLIASSSTRVRNQKGPHLVPAPVKAMIDKAYFWRWSGLEVLEERAKEGTLNEDEKKRLEELRERKDRGREIAEVFLKKVDEMIAERRGGKPSVELVDSLKPYVKELFEKDEIDGNVLDAIGKGLVSRIDSARERGEEDLVEALLRLRNVLLWREAKASVEKRFFQDVTPLGIPTSKDEVVANVRQGMQNLEKFFNDNSRALFGVEVSNDKAVEKKLKDLLGEIDTLVLRGEISQEVYSAVKEIADADSPEKGLPAIESFRKKVLKELTLSASAEGSIQTLLDLKEMQLSYKNMKATFEEIARKVETGEVDPLKKSSLRIAYLPMKGDPWQNGHIWVVAALLASGQVDRVVVSVDNGDPRKPMLSDALVRGPITEALLSRVFGAELVEFTHLPFSDPEHFYKTGEEIVPYLVNELESRLGTKDFVLLYVAGSDHAKFLNVKKLEKGSLERVNTLLRTLERKTGLSFRVAEAQGIILPGRGKDAPYPEVGPSGELVPDGGGRLDPGRIREALHRLIEGQRAQAGGDKQIYATLDEVEEEVDGMSDEQILRTFGPFYSGKSREVPELLERILHPSGIRKSKEESTGEKKVGGLLLSQVRLR